MAGAEETNGHGGLERAKELYTRREYQEAIVQAENSLPHIDNPRILSEAHLFLAKCQKSVGDVKGAIVWCNSAIQTYSKWKEPFLFRSACFQALHTTYQETDGEDITNISKDRASADIIVDPDCQPSQVVKNPDDDKEKMKMLFRREDQRKIFVNRIEDALRLVKDGGKIFVEKGVYEVSSKSSDNFASFFVFGKSISLIGASTAGCVLLYRSKREVSEFEPESKLATFLIASNSTTPTLIKRFTFRNENATVIKTKFLGVAGGSVQIEDCVFDGSGSTDVDAVYTNSKICGGFSANYPTPYIIARYCIFDQCQAYATITTLHSCANIKSSYFTGCGRMAVSAQDSSKVTVENCEFALTDLTEKAISGTSSDLTVTGSFISGLQPCDLDPSGNGEEFNNSIPDSCPVEPDSSSSSSCYSSCHGVGASLRSVAKVTHSYFYRMGTGVSSSASDLTCSGNMFYSCSRRYRSRVNGSGNIGFHTAITIRDKSKVVITGNVAKHCDVGISISGLASTPAIRDNVFDSAFFAGIFAENGAKPMVVGNTFSGGDVNSKVPRGLGILFLLSAAGMVGRNNFEDFSVSPIIVFTNCHPLLRDNRFEAVSIDEAEQAHLEEDLVATFQSEVARESFFYLVDSQAKERALSDIILKGPPTSYADVAENGSSTTTTTNGSTTNGGNSTTNGGNSTTNGHSNGKGNSGRNEAING